MLNRRNFSLLFVASFIAISFVAFNFQKKSSLCRFAKNKVNNLDNIFFDGWILHEEDIQYLCN
jgi:hypothetical protein